MSQQLLHIRLDSNTYDRVKAEADRQDISIAEFIRRSVEKALSPASAGQPVKPAPVDPVLNNLADGLRKAAFVRGIPTEAMIGALLNMLPPILELESDESPDQRLRLNMMAPPRKKSDLPADALTLNIKATDEPPDDKRP